MMKICSTKKRVEVLCPLNIKLKQIRDREREREREIRNYYVIHKKKVT